MDDLGDLDDDVFQEAVLEHARFLGMDPDVDEKYLWIAEQALTAPLPPDWEQGVSEDGTPYHYNVETGESIWEHPRDEEFKEMFIQMKEEDIQKRNKDFQHNEREYQDEEGNWHDDGSSLDGEDERHGEYATDQRKQNIKNVEDNVEGSDEIQEFDMDDVQEISMDEVEPQQKQQQQQQKQQHPTKQRNQTHVRQHDRHPDKERGKHGQYGRAQQEQEDQEDQDQVQSWQPSPERPSPLKQTNNQRDEGHKITSSSSASSVSSNSRRREQQQQQETRRNASTANSRVSSPKSAVRSMRAEENLFSDDDEWMNEIVGEVDNETNSQGDIGKDDPQSPSFRPKQSSFSSPRSRSDPTSPSLSNYYGAEKNNFQKTEQTRTVSRQNSERSVRSEEVKNIETNKQDAGVVLRLQQELSVERTKTQDADFQVSRLESLLRNQTQQAQNLKQVVEDSTQEAQVISGDLKRARADLVSRTTELNAVRQQLKSIQEQSGQDVMSIQNEFESAKVARDEAVNKLLGATNRLADSERDRCDLQVELAKSKQLTVDAITEQNKIQQLKAEVEVEILSLKKELVDKNQNVQSDRERVVELESTVRDLKAQIEGLNATNEVPTADAAEAQVRKSEQIKAEATARAYEEKVKKVIAEKHDMLREMERQRMDFKERVMGLEASNRKLDSDLRVISTEQETRIGEAEVERSQAVQSLRECERKLMAAESQIRLEAVRTQRNEKKLEEAQTTIEDLRAHVNKSIGASVFEERALEAEARCSDLDARLKQHVKEARDEALQTSAQQRVTQERLENEHEQQVREAMEETAKRTGDEWRKAGATKLAELAKELAQVKENAAKEVSALKEEIEALKSQQQQQQQQQQQKQNSASLSPPPALPPRRDGRVFEGGSGERRMREDQGRDDRRLTVESLSTSLSQHSHIDDGDITDEISSLRATNRVLTAMLDETRKHLRDREVGERKNARTDSNNIGVSPGSLNNKEFSSVRVLQRQIDQLKEMCEAAVRHNIGGGTDNHFTESINENKLNEENDAMWASARPNTASMSLDHDDTLSREHMDMSTATAAEQLWASKTYNSDNGLSSPLRENNSNSLAFTATSKSNESTWMQSSSTLSLGASMMGTSTPSKHFLRAAARLRGLQASSNGGDPRTGSSTPYRGDRGHRSDIGDGYNIEHGKQENVDNGGGGRVVSGNQTRVTREDLDASVVPEEGSGSQGGRGRFDSLFNNGAIPRSGHEKDPAIVALTASYGGAHPDDAWYRRDYWRRKYLPLKS